jgi:heat shock protein HtpX
MWNTFKTFSLLALLTGLLLGIGYFFGGLYGATIGLIFAGLINFISYWYSDKIVLKMYGAREISPGDNPTIYQMVGRLSDNAGIPAPKVYEINTMNPNAFATGRNPKNSAVAVTRGLMQHLEPEEIEGVLAHEISHIKNRDTLISTVSATIAGAVTWLAHILGFSLLFGGRDRGNAGGAIFMFLFAPLAASIVRLAISRNREFMADATGAKISQKPLALASALKKINSIARARPLAVNESTSHMFIINPLKANTIANLFSTHPPTEERVRRLEEMAM